MSVENEINGAFVIDPTLTNFSNLDKSILTTYAATNRTLKFSINGALDSLEFVGGTDLPDQNIFTRNEFDLSNRTFTLIYTHSFGNSKLKSSRKRKLGLKKKDAL